MTDMVYMTHPEVEGTAGPVSRKAFERAHAPKGWVLADNPETTSDEDTKSPRRSRATVTATREES